MATFIMKGKYSLDSVKKISGKRTVTANEIVRKCGGSIVNVYATLGEADILAIAEFPGIAEAMKASVELSRELGISFATTPALAVEEFDRLIGGKS